jgi:hypothetical protein
MNEEYLWDKSGEPDLEIQQLEDILGILRYQPRPLELPKELLVSRRRTYFPLLAIAATVVIALVATGLWLRVATQKSPPQTQVKIDRPAASPTQIINEREAQVSGSVEKEQRPNYESRPSHRRPLVVASNRIRRPSAAQGLAKREREEAWAAKEQLLLALRLASEKLNLAHKKTQGSGPSSQIKNQHKVG